MSNNITKLIISILLIAAAVIIAIYIYNDIVDRLYPNIPETTAMTTMSIIVIPPSEVVDMQPTIDAAELTKDRIGQEVIELQTEQAELNAILEQYEKELMEAGND